MEQIIELVSQGVLVPFCNLLNTKEAKTVLVVLDGLSNILQVSVVGIHAQSRTYMHTCGIGVGDASSFEIVIACAHRSYNSR